MRYLTIWGVALFALAVCAMPSAAQVIPPGSYQQTCTDVSVVNGSTLTARCQDFSGAWRSSRLTNFQDCNGEIINDNGLLRCYGYGYGHRRDDYDRDRDNDVYDRGYYQGGYPAGDYVQTCRNIRTEGDRLEAECQKRNGDWRRTSLDDFDRCSSPIVNDNGRLICNQGDYSNGDYGYNGGYNGGYYGGIPSGTYTQTCRNIHTNGDRLEAECQKRNGDWRRTSLDDFDRCRSAIANDNGRLVCGR